MSRMGTDNGLGGPTGVVGSRDDIGIGYTPPPTMKTAGGATPTPGGGATTYPHYCPICMMHFSRILEADCCHHNLCEVCALDLCVSAVNSAPLSAAIKRHEATRAKSSISSSDPEADRRAQLLGIVLADGEHTTPSAALQDHPLVKSVYRGVCLVMCPFCARHLRARWRATGVVRNYKDTPQQHRVSDPSPIPMPPQRTPEAQCLNVNETKRGDSTFEIDSGSDFETPPPREKASIEAYSTRGNTSESPQVVPWHPGRGGGGHNGTVRGWSIGSGGDTSGGCYASLRANKSRQGDKPPRAPSNQHAHHDDNPHVVPATLLADGLALKTAIPSPVRAGDGFEALRRKIKPLERISTNIPLPPKSNVAPVANAAQAPQAPASQVQQVTAPVESTQTREGDASRRGPRSATRTSSGRSLRPDRTAATNPLEIARERVRERRASNGAAQAEAGAAAAQQQAPKEKSPSKGFSCAIC